jgi:hypothetical protein
MREAAYPSAWIKRDAGLGRWKETPPMFILYLLTRISHQGVSPG